jgi:hypothetical protein
MDPREHGIDPGKVVIDHNNEETVRGARPRLWAAFTIYPKTKMATSAWSRSAVRFDAGHRRQLGRLGRFRSRPCRKRLGSKERGIAEEAIRETCYLNAPRYGQSGQIGNGLDEPGPVDQTRLFSGNSVLRGQEPRIEEPEARRAEIVIE